jgi:RNA polymerase-binding transcription factor DksA
VAKKPAPAKPKPAAKPIAKAKPAKAPAKVAAKKPAPKPGAKPSAKPAVKPAAKPVAKVEAKKPVPAAKTPAKPVAKVDPKGVAKGPVKPAPTKVDPKAVVKPGAKPVAKIDPKAAVAKPEPKKAVVPLGKTDVKAPPKKMKPPVVPVMPPGIGRLMDSGIVRKPLIPSGPKAAQVKPLGSHVGDGHVAEPQPMVKTNLSAEQLEEFKQLLLKKRQQLVGDITGMENEALRAGSGSLSNMPSHLAEQGSEAYDQSLSLNLAAADRKLLREIDDALKRIEEGTYGICELSLKPIKIERLRELPWARHSMEAARELERQSMRKF